MCIRDRCIRVVRGSNFFDPIQSTKWPNQRSPSHSENLDPGPNPTKPMAVSVDEFSECKNFWFLGFCHFGATTQPTKNKKSRPNPIQPNVTIPVCWPNPSAVNKARAIDLNFVAAYFGVFSISIDKSRIFLSLNVGDVLCPQWNFGYAPVNPHFLRQEGPNKQNKIYITTRIRWRGSDLGGIMSWGFQPTLTKWGFDLEVLSGGLCPDTRPVNGMLFSY